MAVTSILLDTSCYARFVASEDKVFQQIQEADTVYLSVVVLGELYAGFLGGEKLRQNEKILQNFSNEDNVKLLGITPQIARIYGEIVFDLQKKGKPIPTNDMWIAAQAIGTKSVLVTYDKHFLQIVGLKLWK